MLSSSEARPLIPDASEQQDRNSELTAAGRLVVTNALPEALANALPEALALAAALRSLLLLLPPPLLRVLRSAIVAAGTTGSTPDAPAVAPVGSGNSELPVAAVLKGLAAAAAKGLHMLPLPLRLTAGLMLPCLLLLWLLMLLLAVAGR